MTGNVSRERAARGARRATALFLLLLVPPAIAEGRDATGTLNGVQNELSALLGRIRQSIVTVTCVEPGQGRASMATVGASGTPRDRRVVGSGVIVDPGGTILTTASIATEPNRIEVMLSDGRRYRATLVGADRLLNLAVLEIDQSGLIPCPLGRSADVTPGSWIFVVTSGEGGRALASFGVMERNRGVPLSRSKVELMQMSAPVYPGGSGGALLNARGELIGIVAGRLEDESGTRSPNLGTSGTYAGTRCMGAFPAERASLAIPIETAIGSIRTIREKGAPERPYLGVLLVPAPAGRSGAIVEHVVEGSPAKSSGVHEGDLIVEYDGRPVRTMNDLSDMVLASTPGQRLTIRAERGKQNLTFTLRIAALPDEVPEVPSARSARNENLREREAVLEEELRRLRLEISASPGK